MTHFTFCNRLQIHTEKLSVQCSNVECSGRRRGTYIRVDWIFPYRGILGYAGWKDLFSLNVLFPISDNLMVPQRTVSFKCHLIHAYPRASVCIIYERQKVNSPENIEWYELGNKTYKIKRSIPWHGLTSGLLQLTIEQLSTINKVKDYKKASTWSR